MQHELPPRLDLDFYRKDAKSLVRAYRAGEPQAVERAENVLGERARSRFILSDAQYVLASEHGHRSWPDFRREVERTRAGGPSPAEDVRLKAMRVALEDARKVWAGRGEVVLDAGMTYGAGEPVRILVRERERRYDIDDQGGAVLLAGKPAGWLEVAKRVVDAHACNVNRRGVVCWHGLTFARGVEGRDPATLAWRLAAASVDVYQELLELRL
jgi:hypothetical protein